MKYNDPMNYYRVMLGRGCAYAQEAHDGNFIGVDFGIEEDLTDHLPDSYREFNREYIPKFLEIHPDRSRVAAGLACGMLHTFAKRILIGDIVLCPDGHRNYFVGEIVGDYEYHKGENLPHRRSVRWLSRSVSRDDMSAPLQNATGAIGTLSNISGFADELETLLSGSQLQTIVTTDKTVEDPCVFALEKHLEDFLVRNWESTPLGQRYDIYEEEGEKAGQQYPTDVGPIDILALSKDRKEIAVVELKKGRASDAVVGQVQSYMGYVKEALAEDNQNVRGIIIAFEDDTRIRRALSVASNIDFYTYQVHFKLEKH